MLMFTKYFFSDNNDYNSMDYINSSSIQCAQRDPSKNNQVIPGINLDNSFSPYSETPELSSQSRIQSFNNKEPTEDEQSIDNFEVCTFCLKL